MWLGLILILIASVISVTGCAPEEEVTKEPNQEENYESEWELSEIKEIAEKAFYIYYRQTQGEVFISEVFDFTGDAKRELYKGNLTVNIPGVREYIDEIQVDIKDVSKGKSQTTVTAVIKFPHVKRETFASIKEDIAEAISTSQGEPLDLEEIFIQALAQQELAQEATIKRLVIEKDGEKLKVTQIDAPHEVFFTFDKIYREAIAEKIDDVTLQADADNYITYDTSAYGTFNDTEISIKNFNPKYLASKTTIILDNNIKLPLEPFWNELQTLEGTVEPFLDVGPDSFFHHIRLGETLTQGKSAVYLTRPYRSLTMDAAVGYVNLDTGQVNLITVINGPGESASDFYWSLDGEYVAYHWIASGSGHSYLHIYDLIKDEIISFYDLKGIEVTEAETFAGQFQDLQWSKDGEKLHFNLKKPQEVEEDGEVSSWTIDVKERKLETAV